MTPQRFDDHSPGMRMARDCQQSVSAEPVASIKAPCFAFARQHAFATGSVRESLEEMPAENKR
jgi:hypothetical protein